MRDPNPLERCVSAPCLLVDFKLHINSDAIISTPVNVMNYTLFSGNKVFPITSPLHMQSIFPNVLGLD
jgi:hypothetical protein